MRGLAVRVGTVRTKATPRHGPLQGGAWARCAALVAVDGRGECQALPRGIHGA